MIAQSARLGPNEHLINIAGSRRKLTTPALIIQLGALETNIAFMAEQCRTQGIALRPHAKTHKSVEIAARQIKAGAIGISCSSLHERRRCGSTPAPPR